MIKFINFLFFLLILNACDSKSCDTKNNSSDNQSNNNSNDIQPPPTDPDALAKADAQIKITNAETKIKEANTAKNNTKADAKQLNLAIKSVQDVITRISAASKKADIEFEVENLKLRLVDLQAALDAFVKDNANALVADNTIVVDAEKVQNTITDAVKKQEITKSIKEINTLKDEINTAISNANTDVATLEDLSSKLKSKTDSLIILKNTAAAGLITPEQTQAKQSAQIVADSAEQELNKAKDILNNGTLSDSKDLDSKQKALGQALMDFRNLSATASADDIKAVQDRIVNSLKDLNEEKTKFDVAEKEAKRVADEKAERERLEQEKAKREEEARKLAAEKAKKTAAPKKDFPYTLLTLQGGDNLLMGAQQMVSPYANERELTLSTNYSANELYVIAAMNRSNKIAVYKPGNNNTAIQLTAENSNYKFAKVFPHPTLEKIIVHSTQNNSTQNTGSIKLNDNDIYIGTYAYFNKNMFLSSDKDLISFNDKNIQIIKNNNNKYDEESTEHTLKITSAVALKNDLLLTTENNISLYNNDILNPTNLTDNIKEKIKDKTDNNAKVFNIKLLSIANNTLFVTYEQGNNFFITTCILNDEQNAINSCNEKPLLLGNQVQITNTEVSVAKDLQSALIYNIGKGLIFYKDNILTKIISGVEPTKDMPIKTSSVEGLDPQTICGSVFTAGVTSAAKVEDTWYVYADKNGVLGTATDGMYKICKIKEEIINP